MAQYAVLLYAQRAGADTPPTPPEELAEQLAEHDRHAEELEQSGKMLAAVRLKPSAMATSIRGDAITDGPFIEAKEVVAGFYILEAPDLDAALEIAKRNPINHQGGGVEVRPVAGSSIPSPAQTASRAG